MMNVVAPVERQDAKEEKNNFDCCHFIIVFFSVLLICLTFPLSLPMCIKVRVRQDLFLSRQHFREHRLSKSTSKEC